MSICVICNQKVEAPKALIATDLLNSFHQGMKAMNEHYIACYNSHIKNLNEKLEAVTIRATKAEKIIDDEQSRDFNRYVASINGYEYREDF